MKTLFALLILREGKPLVPNEFSSHRNNAELLCYPLSWISCQPIGLWFEMPRRLTHWGRVTHICVSKLTTIGSDNGLSPVRRQAIIWTNAGILLIRPLAIKFNEILIGNQTFSLKKIHLKMSSAKWRPFCLGLNVLSHVTESCTCMWPVCWCYSRRPLL